MELESYQEKVSEILKSIGLNKNEIVIYLDLIRHKSSPALEISRRTKIHRSNVYDSLRELTEKGFVKEYTENNKKMFQALEPSKISNYLEQKKKELDSIVPELNKYLVPEDKEGAVSLSEGAFAAREALYDLLNLNSDILVYGASQASVDTFGFGFLEEFHKERAKRKIKMLHIYNKDAMERIKYLNKKKRITEARYLSEKFSTNAATVICGNTVLFLVFGKPVFVIKLVNNEISNAYRNYFNILWAKAKT